jgi:outer membrane protein assembly factor BamA
LRAWQARSVGPEYAQPDTTFTIPNQTGDMRLEANLEYRFPLFWNFEGAVFADAGNVWNIKENYTSKDAEEDGDIITRSKEGLFKFNSFYRHIAADWGAGLRLNLDFVLLRLDMGMKIYDPAQNSWIGPRRWLRKGNYGVQFGVGYPF